LSALRQPGSMLTGTAGAAGAGGSARGFGSSCVACGRTGALRTGAAGRGARRTGAGAGAGATTDGAGGAASNTGAEGGSVGWAGGSRSAAAGGNSGSGAGCACTGLDMGSGGSGSGDSAGAGSNSSSKVSGSGRGAIAPAPNTANASTTATCSRPEAASAGLRRRSAGSLAPQCRASTVSAGSRSGRSSAGRLILMTLQRSAQWHCRFTSACALRRFSVSSLAMGVSRNMASRPPKPPCCMRKMVSARS